VAGSEATREILSRSRAYMFPWGKGEPPVSRMIDFCLLAEELGLAGVNVPWHYTVPKTKSFLAFGTRYLIDPVAIVPMILARTERLVVGLEFALPALHPFVWAQYFASLDMASNGRVLVVPVLGWWEEDYKVGLVDKKVRGKRMEEAISTMRALWNGEPITERGECFDSVGLELNPRPVQDPLPVWIGGSEAQAERAARYAQAIYPLFPTSEEVQDVWIPIAKRALEYGRPQLEIAVVNYVLAHDDPAWFEEYAHPRLLARINGLTLDEAVERMDDPTLNRPTERLMVGSNEECAVRLVEILQSGVDHVVVDFYMHGWEPVEFGEEQMRRYAEEIVPLAAQMMGS